MLKIKNILILSVLIAFIYGQDLHLVQKDSTLFYTDFTLDTDASLSNGMVLSIDKSEVISGKSNSLSNNDVVCANAKLKVDSTLSGQWGNKKIETIVASAPGNLVDYSSKSGHNVRFVSKNEMTTLKSCASEFWDFSFPPDSECYKILHTGPLYPEAVNYVLAKTTLDPVEHQAYDKRADMNILCAGTMKLKRNGATIASWDLKDFSKTQSVVNIPQGVQTFDLETDSVECIGGLEQPDPSCTTDCGYGNLYQKIPAQMQDIKSSITLEAKDTTPSVVMGAFPEMKIPAGGSIVIPISIENTGDLTVRVISVGDFGASGFKFENAGDPAVVGGIAYTNYFNKPIEPGETKLVFVRVTAPDNFNGQKKISLAVGFDIDGFFCPGTSNVINGQGEFAETLDSPITATEIPSAIACSISPGSAGGDPGTSVKLKLICTDENGNSDTCPDKSQLDFKFSNSIAALKSYSNENIEVNILGSGGNVMTISTNSKYSGYDFSCEASINGFAAESSGIPQSCSLAPNPLSGTSGSKVTLNTNCFDEKGVNALCNPTNEVTFDISNKSVITGTSGYNQGKVDLTLGSVGSSDITFKTSKFSCTSVVQSTKNTVPVIPDNNVTNCDINPNNQLGKSGDLLLYSVTCTNNQGSEVTCPKKSDVVLSLSNSSIGKIDDYTGKSIKVSIKNDGKSSLIMTNAPNYPTSFFCRSGINNVLTEPPKNETNTTTPSESEMCTLTTPNVMEENKPFDVGISCLHITGSSQEEVQCQNVTWTLTGKGTLNNQNNNFASVTILDKTSSIDLSALVNGSYTCKIDNLKTKNNACTIQPGIWIGAPGETKSFSLQCKNGDKIEDCGGAKWTVVPGYTASTDPKDPTNSSKIIITAPTKVDESNKNGNDIISVTANGLESGNDYVCDLKAYIGKLVCNNYI